MSRTTILKQDTIEAMRASTSRKIETRQMSLRIIDGPHKGVEYRLEHELIRIGRAEWCDLFLPQDESLSKIHCECWLEEKGLHVRDLDSLNGIQINGVEVIDAYLKDGDTLKVGQTTLKLHSSQQTQEVDVCFRDPTGILVGKSRKMRKIFSMLSKVANRNIPVLLRGETGTGKTTIAHALHQMGKNSKAPFVVVSCGALPSNLIESALFGHEKGAFTGADKASKGFFEQAEGGTIFLDEIGELPIHLQPKLLDVLERRMVRRIGGTKEIPVNLRILTATHRNLEKEIKRGTFREDLFFRISVLELTVPALRERREDIAILTQAFLHDLCPNQNILLTNSASQALEEHLWPGNIRELRNVLERSITFLEGNVIEAADLHMESRSFSVEDTDPGRSHSTHNSDAGSYSELATPNRTVSSDPNETLQAQVLLPFFPLKENEPPRAIKDLLFDVECLIIKQALQECNFHAPTAAKLLNISESWLYARFKRYGIDPKMRGSDF